MAGMADLGVVERVVVGLPGTEEGVRYRMRTWKVGGKAYVWVRPFSKADLKRFGDEAPPAGEILALVVEDLAEKEAVLAARVGDGFFTIPHFDGFSAVLVELEKVSEGVLKEALVDAWLVHAPAEVAKDYLAKDYLAKD